MVSPSKIISRKSNNGNEIERHSSTLKIKEQIFNYKNFEKSAIGIKRNFFEESKKENKGGIIGTELGLSNSKIIVADNRERIIRNGFRMRVQGPAEISKFEVSKMSILICLIFNCGLFDIIVYDKM